MDWSAKSHQHRHHQALSPVGETVPSRRHNQTDSESGKEANEANTEEVQVSLLFFPTITVKKMIIPNKSLTLRMRKT